MAIHQVVHQRKEENQKQGKKAVNAYVTSLMRTLVKAFGLENVACSSYNCCKEDPGRVRTHFNSILYKGRSALSKRERLRQWREPPKVNCLLDILKSISDPNSFDKNEKLFNFAQKATSRIGYISEKIDIPYEISKEKELQQIEL